MLRTFRKEKMINRLKKEGRIDQVRPEDYELMDLLDGEQGNDYNWESVVKDNPLVWIEATDKHGGAYVCLEDCDPW